MHRPIINCLGYISNDLFEQNQRYCTLECDCKNSQYKTINGRRKNHRRAHPTAQRYGAVSFIVSHIVKPLSYICNMSLTSGIFPNNMKIAKVIPLYKANGKNEFTNYRPVSLLPQFSKILEKLFGIRLDYFIDRYNLVSSNQYGFRRNMSTSLALMELTEEITTALDDKKSHCGCLY